jgi:hypothetical protein
VILVDLAGLLLAQDVISRRGGKPHTEWSGHG